jgi:hypothetical protein
MDSCPECNSNKVISRASEGDTYFRCQRCEYTVENGVLTRPSRFNTIFEQLRKTHNFTLEECGSCGCYHRPEWYGDCRNDAERFEDPADLARKYWAKAIDECADVCVEKIFNAGDSQYGVKVDWEYIGEGLSGDYNDEDENDMPLFRFYIYYSENGGLDWGEGVEDASYCTSIPVDTPKETMEKLAQKIIDKVKLPLIAGKSVKKICEKLSWLDESDIE